MEPQNTNARTLLPTVGDSYGHGWETMKKYFLELFLVFIVVAAVSMPMVILNAVSSIGLSPALFLLKPLVFMYGIFLMIPVTIASSLAFMLPTATPPNAIVFGTNRLRISTMVRTGFLLNMIGILIVSLITILMGDSLFGFELGKIPEWVH